jgi:protein SCO1/2
LRAVSLAVCLPLTALGLSACDRPGAPSGSSAAPPPATAFKGIDITGADYAQELSLPDAEGQRRSLADFKGKVVVVFFGYTQCPDVCPTTMSELAEVKRRLGPDGDKLQGIFVTVDPQRDTPELLSAYVKNFDPGFVALRGSPEETEAAAKHFKVFFAKVPGRTETSYTIDHTAGAYMFDMQGRVRIFTRYGTGIEALVDDIKQLMAQG